MKKALFLFCPFLLGYLGLAVIKNNEEATFSRESYRSSTSAAISCAPGADEALFRFENGKYIGLLPGRGKYSYTITTKSDSAQVYFDQGLSMYYSYHMREALASFREAARFDSSCAAIYWAQALAMGPTYNQGYAYKLPASIATVLEKMNRYAEGGSRKEKDLFMAMNQRYSRSDTADLQRSQHNLRYAEAMKPLVAKYGDDPDVKMLYTDAVMLIHSWDFWHNDGMPKSWTPELVRLCEEVLQKVPVHPGGLHYYIHLTEASRKPEVALASADSLRKLYPGIAHMVHMSSHEYERIGYYAKGVSANEEADKSLVLYDSLAKGLFPRVHVPHYYAVDAYCALSGAMYKAGLPKALTLRESVSPTHKDTYMQYQYMFPLFVMVRMGKWQEIIEDRSVINGDWTYAGLLNDFAKGMAFARTGDYDKAEAHLTSIRQHKRDSILVIKFAPHTSSPAECAVVAENILDATLNFSRKKYTEAYTAINKAIAAEDKLIYSEPKIWLLPARQYAGAFLMQQKRWKEAEKVYRDDLIWNPGNGWSLLGLHQALERQGKSKELKKLQKQYRYSFSEADVLPPGSAY